jgi:hypothetical protein
MIYKYVNIKCTVCRQYIINCAAIYVSLFAFINVINICMWMSPIKARVWF